MTGLEKALVDVASFLDARGIRYMVIGGYANLFWGRPRLTQDLDITILTEERLLPDLIAALDDAFVVLPADPSAFARDTRVLPVRTKDGVRVDLIIAGLPYEFEAIRRARSVQVEDHSVRVCTPEDLIVHKIISERPRDMEDVQGVILRQAAGLDREYLDPLVRELSTALDRPDIWNFYQAALHGEEPESGL